MPQGVHRQDIAHVDCHEKSVTSVPGIANTVPPVTASIIIVNWNGRQHLAECLDSLAAQSYRDFEVVLVDNGSSDGSDTFVREQYPWVKLVPLDYNSGFATGNNIGLAHAAGRYIIALNNDTRTEPAWLAELVQVADDNPTAGMVASRICAYRNHDSIDSLGVALCPDGMSRAASRLRSFSTLHLSPVQEVLLPSGCAALYRREMLDAIGFFDDAFFAYCEDTDLGLRGRAAGWGALLARDAVVYHKYSQTGGGFSPFKLYLVERNHYWVALKNFPATMLLLLPLRTVQRYLEQVRVVLTGQGAGQEFSASSSRLACMTAIMKGMLHAVAGAPAMLAKRQQAARQRRLSSRELTGLYRQYRLTFKELFDAR